MKMAPVIRDACLGLSCDDDARCRSRILLHKQIADTRYSADRNPIALRDRIRNFCANPRWAGNLERLARRSGKVGTGGDAAPTVPDPQHEGLKPMPRATNITTTMRGGTGAAAFLPMKSGFHRMLCRCIARRPKPRLAWAFRWRLAATRTWKDEDHHREGLGARRAQRHRIACTKGRLVGASRSLPPSTGNNITTQPPLPSVAIDYPAQPDVLLPQVSGGLTRGGLYFPSAST
jgi:hypothetical protein